jgi:hypothetical protein
MSVSSQEDEQIWLDTDLRHPIHHPGNMNEI